MVKLFSPKMAFSDVEAIFDYCEGRMLMFKTYEDKLSRMELRDLSSKAREALSFAYQSIRYTKGEQGAPGDIAETLVDYVENEIYDLDEILYAMWILEALALNCLQHSAGHKDERRIYASLAMLAYKQIEEKTLNSKIQQEDTT